MASQLALLGGPKAVKSDPGDMFTWPIVTPDIEEAVLEVLRRGAMSGMDVTRQLEKEFAAWHGMEFALGHNTGTQAIQAAMYAVGVGKGDEIICPSVTYWASCLQVYTLGGTVVFADVDPDTVNIDPNDIEHRITERTKAIVAVHYTGYPADMDPIMDIARRHNLKVIEDCSHAHGALYKGKMVGTFGDVAGFSIMSGKSFAAGEGGLLLTNSREVYERAVAFGHYARHSEDLTLPELVAGAGLPWGGYKNRMNQLTSAMARVQLKKYPAEMAEIDKAMNFFWDEIGDQPGIRSHRPPKGSTKGGWYAPHGLYRPEELGGLSVSRFCEALRAEGVPTHPGCNKALHTHPLFNTIDVYHAGRPTRLANLPEGVDIRQPEGSLPVSEGIQERIYSIPWFKHYRPEIIAEYAAAFRKVIAHYEELLPGDTGNPEDAGGWGLTRRIAQP
ncbi:MAG: DegT/DnrJ/EryC1/StrS family aminotransferase [Anaerolineae bacterium]|jgi:perosamine synthetase